MITRKNAKFFCMATLCVAAITACGEVGADDNEPKGNGACYVQTIVPGADVQVCMEPGEGEELIITRNFCNYLTETDDYVYQYRDSCPRGHKLKCKKEDLYAYYYGSFITKDVTCEMLGAEPL